MIRPGSLLRSAACAAAIAAALAIAGCATPFPDEPTYRPRSMDDHATSASARTEAPREPAAAPSPSAGGARPEVAAEAGERRLSLGECVEIAARNNRNLRIADRRVLIAKDRYTEAYSNLIPRVNAIGKYTARSNDQGAKLGEFEFTFADRQVGTAGVSTIVPIYLFGRVRNQAEAEDLRVDVAGLDAARARQDLDLTVKSAYFRILEAEKIRGVVDESIAVVERQLETSRDFYGQGLVAKSDVLQADVQLAERRQERILAENNVQLAKSSLNRLLGRDVNAALEVEDVIVAEPWKGSFEAAMRAAVARRPDLEALRKSIAIGRAEYRATRSNLMPYVYATGDWSYTSDSLTLNKDWFTGAVVAEFPLFDATTWLKLRRKTKEIAETVDRHDDRVDDILLQVKQAYLGVREAAERIPVARKSIESAEENLRMVRDQYGQGLVSSTDVLTEEDRLARARSLYYRSLYDYHESYARLVNAIAGEPPADPGAGGAKFPLR